MSVDPRLIQPSLDFDAETEAVALARYTGFGRAVFDSLWHVHPHLRDGFQFFRDSSNQSEDIWSFCTTGSREFGLQLDPDIEVICLWDDSGAVEIGTWADDPIADAVAWVTEHCIDT